MAWSGVRRIVVAAGATLTHLNLSRAHGVWLLTLGLHLRCLQTLDLSYCTGIRDTNDVGYVLPNGDLAPHTVAMVTLTRVVLQGARVFVDGNGHVGADEHLPKLLTQHVAHLLRSCPRLEEVDLSHCDVTNAQLRSLTAPNHAQHRGGRINERELNHDDTDDDDTDGEAWDDAADGAGFTHASEDPLLLLLRLETARSPEKHGHRTTEVLPVSSSGTRIVHQLEDGKREDSVLFRGADAASVAKNAMGSRSLRESDRHTCAVQHRGSSVPFEALRLLDLSGNHALTYDGGVCPALIGTACCTLTSQLRSVNLAGCRGISTRDAKQMQRTFPEVVVSWS